MQSGFQFLPAVTGRFNSYIDDCFAFSTATAFPRFLAADKKFIDLDAYSTPSELLQPTPSSCIAAETKELLKVTEHCIENLSFLIAAVSPL
jgi:hypothetical protein